jgi:hypothetical protein
VRCVSPRLVVGIRCLVEMEISVCSRCGLVDGHRGLVYAATEYVRYYPLHYGEVAGVGRRWRTRARLRA